MEIRKIIALDADEREAYVRAKLDEDARATAHAKLDEIMDTLPVLARMDDSSKLAALHLYFKLAQAGWVEQLLQKVGEEVEALDGLVEKDSEMASLLESATASSGVFLASAQRISVKLGAREPDEYVASK